MNKDIAIATSVPRKKSSFLSYLKRDKYLYLLLVPGIMYFLFFRYLPMGGLVIAFKEYDIFQGILKSPWVGLRNFEAVFASADFWNVLKNTLGISFLHIIFGFPVPIILALLLNEMKNEHFKKISQTLLYLPHFISWVVLGGIIMNLLSPTYGIAGEIFRMFGQEPVNILANKSYFWPVLVLTSIWKESGWNTIIYMAALTTIDPGLYEASYIDGASKWKQIKHITLPSISGIIIMLLILKIGQILNAGFEQIMVLQNPLVYSVSDVFDTYVYRVGLNKGQYSFAAAFDFFKSVVALILVVSADKISKYFGEEGLL